MRQVWQRIIGLVAIYTIVIQALAVGFMPAPASAHSLDPFSIICSSPSAGENDSNAAAPAIPAAHGCDHCVLCATTAPPEAPDTASKISFAAPALPFTWPAARLPARSDRLARPELPTGPPSAI
jgi:hypothetical protein